VDDVLPVGFANSSGVVFVNESAEEITAAYEPYWVPRFGLRTVPTVRTGRVTSSVGYIG
jgi:uncharacterized protein YcfL